MKSPLIRDLLLERLDYDQHTGVFRWKVDLGKVRKGDVAGTKNAKGYLLIRLDRGIYRAHRLAWLYVHGRWPADQLDHRNGIRSENWIDNLRESTGSQNNQNRAVSKNNRAGFIGVYCDRGRWRAEIVAEGKRTRLGRFDSAEEASAAYLEAKARLHTFQPVPRSMADFRDHFRSI